MPILYLFLFFTSSLVLFYSSLQLVGILTWIAWYLGWKKFIVAFLAMAFVSSLPNLVIGLNSAFRGIPQLSLGDVFGGNVIDFTLAAALPILIGKIVLPVRSRIARNSVLFTAIVSLLPLIFLLDGELGRGDGMALLLTFGFYVFWIFSKEERFKTVLQDHRAPMPEDIKFLVKNLGQLVFYLFLILLASEGVVRSAVSFANFLNLPLSLIGILIIGPGNALPEIYFAIASAKKKEKAMVLGNLMGSVIVPSTLVLGLVALIAPIKINEVLPFTISRLFVLISAGFFLWAAKTDRKVTRREALFLLITYLAFVVLEVSFK